MDSYQYLLLMAACLVVTLPLEVVLGARVWRRPRRVALALLPVVMIFGAWDVLAISRDTWSYSDRFTTGVVLPLGLPLEELVFFLVVPICGLLTYEAVGNVLTLTRQHLRRPQHDRRP